MGLFTDYGDVRVSVIAMERRVSKELADLKEQENKEHQLMARSCDNLHDMLECERKSREMQGRALKGSVSSWTNASSEMTPQMALRVSAYSWATAHDSELAAYVSSRSLTPQGASRSHMADTGPSNLTWSTTSRSRCELPLPAFTSAQE